MITLKKVLSLINIEQVAKILMLAKQPLAPQKNANSLNFKLVSRARRSELSHRNTEQYMADHTFIVKNNFARDDDRQLFFPDDEPAILLAPVEMADIMVQVGIFPSKGQARKNGYGGEKAVIPPGYTELTVGKLKHKVFIFCPTEQNVGGDTD